MNEQKNINQEYQININITSKAFAGLSHQGLLFHQAVCELCDDAIAAALEGEKAKVCVALAPDRDKNYIQIAVADWGRGMDLDALTNALQLGSLPLGQNRINEHGYGLNNALACLSGGSSDWCIYTRSQPGCYFKVSGPFDLKMTVKTVENIDLSVGLNLQWTEPSTVIYVRVPITIARTLQRQGNRKHMGNCSQFNRNFKQGTGQPLFRAFYYSLGKCSKLRSKIIHKLRLVLQKISAVKTYCLFHKLSPRRAVIRLVQNIYRFHCFRENIQRKLDFFSRDTIEILRIWGAFPCLLYF